MPPSSLPSSPFRLHAPPFDAEGLVVGHLRGHEALSTPFSFVVQAYTPYPIDFSELPAPGVPCTLTIASVDEDAPAPRRIHGLVSATSVVTVDRTRDTTVLEVRIAPRLAQLAVRRTRRIFQNQNVAEIVATLVAPWGIEVEWKLDHVPPPIAYCVQYDESDLDFLHRITGEEGLFYWFAHATADPGTNEAREVVVFSDAPRHYPALTMIDYRGTEQTRVLKLCDREGTYRANEAILSFLFEWRTCPTATRLLEYDFRAPSTVAESTATADEPALSSERLVQDAFRDQRGHNERRLGRRDARLALEGHRAGAVGARGLSDVRVLEPGRKFALDAHDMARLNAEWVVTEVEHEGQVVELTRAAPGATSMVYRNTFRAAPAAVPVLRDRMIRPLRQVTETATVVGPSGEEIHTDEFGRVKVQFHWDRDGQRNDHSSCWLRVATAWAGSQWGTQFIPRMGMEVLVTFLGGDVDNPVVVGAVNNAANMPSHVVPASKTRSGIRTQSTPGGTGFNELAFEDAAGQELVYLRAHRDLTEVVGNVHSTWVGRDQKIEVVGERRDTVVQDAVYTVQKNERRTVHLDLTEKVGGERAESVAGDHTERVGGNRTITVERDEVTRVVGNRLDVVANNEDRRVEADRSEFVEGLERRELGTSVSEVRKDAVHHVDGTYTLVVGEPDAPGVLALHANGSTHLSSSQRTEIVSTTGLVLHCGESTLEIGPDRVAISSPTIELLGSGASARLADDTITFVATTSLRAKSDAVSMMSSGAAVKLTGDAVVEGSAVKLKSSSSGDADIEVAQIEPTTIELVDREGNPLAGERFILVMPDGERRAGFLDADGRAVVRFEGNARLVFPDVGPVEEQ